MNFVSYKYQNQEAVILKAVEKSPGIASAELSEILALEFNVAQTAMQSLVSRMLDKKHLYFKRTVRNDKAAYALYPTPVNGTPEELARIRQPGRAKGAQRVVRQQAQQELPLAKKWETHVLNHIPAPVPAPEPVHIAPLPGAVQGIPVVVDGAPTLIIPFTHMRTAYEVLYYIYNGAAARK